MWEIFFCFFVLSIEMSFEHPNRFFLCWLSPHYSSSAHHNYITAPFHCSCLLTDHLGWLPFGSGLIIQPISSIFNPQGSLPPTPQLMDDPRHLARPFVSSLCSSLFSFNLLFIHSRQELLPSFLPRMLLPSPLPPFSLPSLLIMKSLHFSTDSIHLSLLFPPLFSYPTYHPLLCSAPLSFMLG